MRARSCLALGLLIGTALDAVIADPARGHPVAVFGGAASRAENWIWADSRARGALFALLCLCPVMAGGLAAQRLSRHSTGLRVALTASATWAVLGGRSLAAEASGIASALASG